MVRFLWFLCSVANHQNGLFSSPEDFDEEEDDRNKRKFTSFSRSSSISSSICSCMSCAIQPTEWRKRPSKLLQGYRIEEYYRFDAILGKYVSIFAFFSYLLLLVRNLVHHLVFTIFYSINNLVCH